MTIKEMEMKFCGKVSEIRLRKNISLEELARCSGLPMNMLAALDRDEIPEEMMVNDAFNLAKVFGCETYELFQ